ncbi:nucleotide exchange factor Fes1-domain-containing protein [Lentinula aciculospora]|uniref:Nucleotide exchange factor Fes1-domain-containing protein n=1 Tax=Lentinula aciculospora TaxID=153920 RepID=A0A9W9DXD9_9AGAR|nr:nucleotide exchange factor Fes1-domain-containing protein [Lentinula aciculospora]
MQSLLRWGIENSTPQDGGTPLPERKDLNPEIIDMLLGKSDADLMKEALSIAVDDSRSEDDRVDALDNLEMLIEQIDNANNLEKLNMWEPLHALLVSSPNSVTTQAIWVIGTALQNNPSAQDAYLKLNPLTTLTSCLAPKSTSTSPSKQTRSKVIYALSGLLKHNAPALNQLDVKGTEGSGESDGWDRLRQALQDPDITVRRKTAFLLNSLLTPNETLSTSTFSTSPENPHTPDSQQPQGPIHPNSHSAHLSQPDRASTSTPTLRAMQSHNIIEVLIEALTNPLPYGGDGDKEEPDVDFEEKGVALLRTYLMLCNGPLEQTEKDRIREWIFIQKDKHKTSATSGHNSTGDDVSNLAERWSMSAGELDELVRKVE